MIRQQFEGMDLDLQLIWIKQSVPVQVMSELTKISKFVFDTITDPNYYSNSAASASGLNDASKFGRQFIGAVYQKERKAKSR